MIIEGHGDTVRIGDIINVIYAPNYSKKFEMEHVNVRVIGFDPHLEWIQIRPENRSCDIHLPCVSRRLELVSRPSTDSVIALR